MSRFTYYSARCRHCGNTMRIGDSRSADEILAMIESGEAVSSHTAECDAGWGRAPMSYEVTPDSPEMEMARRVRQRLAGVEGVTEADIEAITAHEVLADSPQPARVEVRTCEFHGTQYAATGLCPMCVDEEREASFER